MTYCNDAQHSAETAETMLDSLLASSQSASRKVYIHYQDFLNLLMF